jgi:predicted dehydrogenase
LEGEDNAVATLRYKNGAIGVIQSSTSVQPSQSRRIEIHGEKGSVLIDGDEVTISMVEELFAKEGSPKNEASGAGSSSPLDGFSFEAHKRQFEAIAEAIQKNEIPPVSGEESLKSLAIVLAIYESAKTNTKVRMDISG